MKAKSVNLIPGQRPEYEFELQWSVLSVDLCDRIDTEKYYVMFLRTTLYNIVQ